jgi:hypothetical protein
VIWGARHFHLVWRHHGAARKVVDGAKVLPWLFKLRAGLGVVAIAVGILIATSSLLVSLLLMLINLLSNRMGHWKHELGTETEVGAKTFRKVLR